MAIIESHRDSFSMMLLAASFTFKRGEGGRSGEGAQDVKPICLQGRLRGLLVLGTRTEM